jgi:hypothetical protein
MPESGLDLLALDAETIAARIFDTVRMEKASGPAAALQRRIWHRRLPDSEYLGAWNGAPPTASRAVPID